MQEIQATAKADYFEIIMAISAIPDKGATDTEFRHRGGRGGISKTGSECRDESVPVLSLTKLQGAGLEDNCDA